MNGVSHMLPFVVGGGILIALAFLIDGLAVDINTLDEAQRTAFGTITPAAALLKRIGETAFSFMLPVLAGFIASAIGDRPALAAGFVGVIIVALGIIGCVFLALITVIYTVLAIVNAVKMKNADYTRKCTALIVLSAIMAVVSAFFAVLLATEFISVAFAAAACVLVLIAQIVIAAKNKSFKCV